MPDRSGSSILPVCSSCACCPSASRPLLRSRSDVVAENLRLRRHPTILIHPTWKQPCLRAPDTLPGLAHRLRRDRPATLCSSGPGRSSASIARAKGPSDAGGHALTRERCMLWIGVDAPKRLDQAALVWSTVRGRAHGGEHGRRLGSPGRLDPAVVGAA